MKCCMIFILKPCLSQSWKFFSVRVSVVVLKLRTLTKHDSFGLSGGLLINFVTDIFVYNLMLLRLSMSLGNLLICTGKPVVKPVGH